LTEGVTDILVVGGGASGLMAAIASARQGCRVVVAERLPRVAQKLLATGNGRCNLSNTDMSLRHYRGEEAWLSQVFGQMGAQETLGLFESMGLVTAADPDGRVFPLTRQSATVVDILRAECRHLGVEEKTGFEAAGISQEAGGFLVRSTGGGLIKACCVVLCTGGRAGPGSEGSGYRLARMLGHRINPLFPCLVQIRLNLPGIQSLKGIRMQASVSLIRGDAPFRTEEGEILWTEDGLSGIPVLNLSRWIQDTARSGRKTALRLDLFPDFSPGRLHALLDGRSKNLGYRTAGESLIGLIHKRLIPFILDRTRMNPETHVSRAGRAWTDRLAESLKMWDLVISGTRSWTEAQVTAGGVDTGEVDPRTMESLKTPGFYLAGELLDVDGECGGYNLQWAWTSGWIAGHHAGLRTCQQKTASRH
jgi:predicted Rossmann fold flavoprotein